MVVLLTYYRPFKIQVLLLIAAVNFEAWAIVGLLLCVVTFLFDLGLVFLKLGLTFSKHTRVSEC